MWQMFKPVIRWPLYSPARLLAVVVGLVVVMMTTSQCGNPSSGPAASPSTGTPTATASVEPTPTPSPTPKALPGEVGTVDPESVPFDMRFDTGPVDGVEAAVDMAAMDSAVAYVTAWSHPELAADQWLAGLAPYVTARHYEQLKTVDPANVAALTVTGEPLTDDPGGQIKDSATWWVPVTGSDSYRFIAVFLIVDPAGHWLVDSAKPVQ